MGPDLGAGAAAPVRVATGELHGHAVGNLLIVALWELLGDPRSSGLDWVGRLLGAQGRVLPMALRRSTSQAEVRGADPARPDELTDGARPGRGRDDARHVVGQSRSTRPIRRPARRRWPRSRRPTGSCSGPGSWFTSVIPHLLVPELRDALSDTGAGRRWSP